MAFRQRRRIRRFGPARFGRPFARRRTQWITSLFNETAINMAAGGPVDQVLVTGLELATTDSGASVGRVRRVIYNGVVCPAPNVLDTLGSDTFAISWALYQIDTEDTDITIQATGDSDIWNTERVLASGVVGGVVVANNNSAGITSQIARGMDVNVDYRQPFTMRQDKLLLMTFQPFSSSTVLDICSVSAIARVLVDTN